MNGYRYTVEIIGATDGETHAAQNLYSATSSPPNTYWGGTECQPKVSMRVVDGQATCEKCIKKIRESKSL